jgi:DNA processing protein
MKHWKKWPLNKLDPPKFPNGFKAINEPPQSIYYRGDWDPKLFDKSIAMVGSRRMTRYGEEVVKKIMPTLVASQTTVVSGFMYGVDTCCHQNCLAMGGRTVAIVGGGLDILTPTSNDELYSKILETGGVVMSELEPNFRPTKWSFPRRDRLMAAVASLGVLVVEGGMGSGSLITAKYALKYGKRVMAIPGPITSKVSAGTNWLIKSGGAKIITGPEDIISDDCTTPIQNSLYKDYSNLSGTERKIIGLLERESLSSDELCRLLRISVDEVSRVTALMLMRDLVVEKNGQFYLG